MSAPFIAPECVAEFEEDRNTDTWKPISSFDDLIQRVSEMVKESEPINKLVLKGFVVLAGQFGDKNQEHDPDSNKGLILRDNRECLIGLVHRDRVNDFSKTLKKHIITDCDKDSVGYSGPSSLIMKSSIPITRIHTFMDPGVNQNMLRMPIDESSWYMVEMLAEYCTNEFKQELENNYVVVGVVSRRWGESSLIKDVHDLLCHEI